MERKLSLGPSTPQFGCQRSYLESVFGRYSRRLSSRRVVGLGGYVRSALKGAEEGFTTMVGMADEARSPLNLARRR